MRVCACARVYLHAHRRASGTPLFMKRSNFFPARSYSARNVPRADVSRDRELFETTSRPAAAPFYSRLSHIATLVTLERIRDRSGQYINNDFWHFPACVTLFISKSRRDKNWRFLNIFRRDIVLISPEEYFQKKCAILRSKIIVINVFH